MATGRDITSAARDPYAGSTNLLSTTPYLSRKPIRVTTLQDQTVEAISIGWLLAATVQDFTVDNVVLNAFAGIAPRAVVLGQRVVESMPRSMEPPLPFEECEGAVTNCT